MINRTALAALLLALAAPSWAAGQALQDARRLAGGNPAVYDNGCSGGSCGAEAIVNTAADGALKTGGLAVRPQKVGLAPVAAEVPAPALGAAAEGSTNKPGFFKKLFSGKAMLYGLGGGAAGAGIGWLVGGPLGALIGGLIGAVGGYFLSKMLAK